MFRTTLTSYEGKWISQIDTRVIRVLTRASSLETPLDSIKLMSDAILLVWVFWYRIANRMTKRSLFQGGTAASVTTA